MLLSRLVSILINNPHIAESLSINSLFLFVQLLHHIRLYLSWHGTSPSYAGPPYTLPNEVVTFLAQVLALDLRTQFGMPLGIGFYDQFLSNQVVIFTREYGPIPSWSYSACCPNCSARFYSTYYVKDQGKLHMYYSGQPELVHVTMHAYLEASLCCQFSQSTMFAWVSATNHAWIYQAQHIEAQLLFPPWSIDPKLTTNIVWDAIFLYVLLCEYDKCRTMLVLSNEGNFSERLDGALQQCNTAIIGPGQEHWNHACDLCCHIHQINGHFEVIHCVIMDGINVTRGACRCQGISALSVSDFSVTSTGHLLQ
ncbi:hypothetical protein ABKN59_007778 [Abortiporus biennis]